MSTINKLLSLLVLWVCVSAPVTASGRSAPGRDRAPEAPAPAVARTVWAVPAVDGPIKALFIAPRFTGRDIFELAARIQIKYEFVGVWGADRLGDARSTLPDASEEAVVARLSEGMEGDFDVFVLANVDPAILPAGVLDGLARRVREGKGLLLVNPIALPPALETLAAEAGSAEGAEDITRGVGESMTPEWPNSLSFVHASGAGSGRLVRLDYVGGRPITHCLLPVLSDPVHARQAHYDTYLSLVARAVRWAAGRRPALWIKDMARAEQKGPSEEEIPPELPEEFVKDMRDGAPISSYDSFQIEFNAPAARSYDVRAALRNPRIEERAEFVELPQIPKGAARYLLELPVGPGDHYLDLWILDRERVVEWHTLAVRREGWPEVSRIAYSKAFLVRNDALTISLDVVPSLVRPRPCTVYARAIDSLGRLVAEAAIGVAAEGGPADVTLSFADLIANMVRVEVYVTDRPDPNVTRWDRQQAGYSHVFYMPVLAPQTADSFTLAAAVPDVSEYNARAFLNVLAREGVSAVGAPPTDDGRFHLASLGLRPIPELLRLGLDGADMERLADPMFLPTQTVSLHEQVSTFQTVGATLFSLGNHNVPVVPLPGEVTEGFHLGLRQTLRRDYASLQELNSAWSSGFGTWDSVRLGEERFSTAEWMDLCRHADILFDQALRDASGGVTGAAPDALAGCGVMEHRQYAARYDWWRLSQLGLLAIPPDPVILHKVRSFRTFPSWTAVYLGDETLQGDGAAKLPWVQAFHGCQATWISSPFGTAETDALHPALLPSGEPSAPFQAFLEAHRQLRDTGLGTMLVRARPVPAQVAILASRISPLLDETLPAAHGSCPESEFTFVKVLEELGYPFDFVTPEQAVQGRLDAYKVLIIPMVRALEADVAEVVARFVASGGAVLADVVPGQFDRHGTPQPDGPLDAVFGIRRETPGASSEALSGVIQWPSEEVSAPIPVDGVFPDSATAPVSAEVLGKAGESPVWLRNLSGEGTALLANYPALREDAGSAPPEQWATLLRRFLQDVGLRPALGIESLKQPLTAARFCRSFGKATIYGLLAEAKGKAKRTKLHVSFGEAVAAYDARAGTRIHRPGKALFLLPEDGVAVFTVLPYEVSEVALVAPDRVQQGRRLNFSVELRTKGEIPGPHLAQITLRPAGQPTIEHYTQVLVLQSGQCQGFVPLALNESPGPYEVTARDALTGLEATAVVQIEGSGEVRGRGSPDFSRKRG